MTMRTEPPRGTSRRIAGATGASLAFLLLAAGCASTGAHEAAHADTHEPDAMMARMAAAAEPGPMHAWLLEDVGAWKGESTSWPGIGAEPIVMPASFTVEPMLGGRFAACRSSAQGDGAADGAGMPDYDGLAITGYDNAAGEFQSMWIDTYGTTMMTGSGTRSSDGRTLSMCYGYFCPIRGRRAPMWQEIVRESPTRQVHRLWAEDLASGTKYQVMEAVYERVEMPSRDASHR